MLRVFERVLDRNSPAIRRLEASLHHHPVGADVEAPLLEVADLVLGLADHDLDDRALHPLRLATQGLDLPSKALPGVRIRGGLSLCLPDRNEGLDLGKLRLPTWPDPLKPP